MQVVPGSIPTSRRKSVEISVGFGTQSATEKYYEASYSMYPVVWLLNKLYQLVHAMDSIGH